MKQSTKRFVCILLSVMLILSISALAVFAEGETTMSITLRIEGINANMYYKTVEVPYTETLTLQAALTYIDAQENSIAITGVDAAYITDINGDTAAKFGGWDGWMYKVNGTDAAVGIDGYNLADNDKVVLYYGDPYGVGMQFPVADTTKISGGIIKFTSSDTTYDANYKPTVTVNPVVGATVSWTYNSTTATYTTDENGEIVIDKAQLTEGAHTIQISKISYNGIPLVLRFASDYTIPVAAANNSEVSEEVSTESSESISSESSENISAELSETVNTEAPKTGDSGTGVMVLIAVSAIAFSALMIKRKNVYEK